MKFYHYKKKGGEDLAMLEGRGDTGSLGAVFTLELEVFIMHTQGGPKRFHPLEGECVKLYPVFEVGGGGGSGSQTVSNLQCSHFVTPPPPPCH